MNKIEYTKIVTAELTFISSDDVDVEELLKSIADKVEIKKIKTFEIEK